MNADNLDRKLDELVIAELGDQTEKDEAINKGDCRSAVTNIEACRASTVAALDRQIDDLAYMKDEAIKLADYPEAAKIRDQMDEAKLVRRKLKGEPTVLPFMNALSTHVDGLFAKQAERKAEKQNHEVLQKRWLAGFAADWDKAAVRSDKPKLEPQLKRSDGFLKAIVLCDDKVARPADLHSLEEADVIVTTSGKVLKNRYGKTWPTSAPSLPSADSRNRSDKPHIVDWGMSPEAVYALLAMTEDRTRLRAELHGLQASHDRLLAACRRFTGSHAAALGASIHGDGTDQPPATPTCECAECKFTRDAISQGLKPGAEDVRPPREDAPREDRNHLNRKALAREALETLSGDLSYDNVAAAKQILKQITGETK